MPSWKLSSDIALSCHNLATNSKDCCEERQCLANIRSQTSVATTSRRTEIRGLACRAHSGVLTAISVTNVSGRLVHRSSQNRPSASVRHEPALRVCRQQPFAADLA